MSWRRATSHEGTRSDGRQAPACSGAAYGSIGAVVLALLLSAVPAVIRAVYYPNYAGTDDSFIHAAIIDSLRQGHGWGINPGEPVNLSTSPLFTLLMLAVSYVAPDLIAAGSAITTAAVAAGIFCTFVVASRLTASGAIGVCVAALAAANIHFWRWTGTFIEAPLAFAGVIMILVVFQRLYMEAGPHPDLRRFAGLGFAIGLLSLLRYECALLGLGFFTHHVVNDRRFLISRYASTAAGFLVPLTVWGAFALATFGTIIPTTFAAKTSPGFNFANFGFTRQAATTLGAGSFASAVLLGGSIFVLVVHRAHNALAGALRQSVLFVTFAVSFLAFYYLKTPTLQSPARYLLPAISVLPLAIAPFLAAARPLVGAPWRHVAALTIAAQFLSAFIVNQMRVAPVLRQMSDEYVAAMTEAAAELDRRCHPGDVALIEFDIGVVSYRHDRTCRIRDGGALASPELRGLSVAEKIEATHARFVVESLGAPGDSAVVTGGEPLKLLWSRTFLSHSVGIPDRIYVVRLFEVLRGHMGNVPSPHSQGCLPGANQAGTTPPVGCSMPGNG